MLNKLAFRLNFSEIEERLDPIFYYKRSNLDLVNKTSLPVYKLKDVINMQRGRFGHRPRNDPSLYNGKYPFIQTGDVVRAKCGSEISHSQTLNDKGLKTSRLFSEPVVVLTIAANIGYTAILNYPACFPDSLIGLTSKNDLLELEYINIYISVIRQYIEDLAPQAAQKNINYQQLASIPIVVPAKDIQRKIIDLWNTAQDLDKIKRNQAKEKLSLIDAYLLDKLGVEHKEKKLNVESRIFTMPFRNLVGKRFDPIYYNSDLDQFNKGNFISIKLKMLIKEFSSGQGVGRQDQVSEEEGILQIRPTNLGPRGSFLFQKNIFVPDEARHKCLQKGDVIFNNTNSQELVGKSAYWDIDLEATYSNHITVLRVNENKLFPEYLTLILNLYQKSNIFYSICTNWNNQSGVGIDALLDLNIPLPPLALQEEIISHIRQIRNEAKKLEEEANLVLEKAKQEIEKMILGETV